VWVTPLNSKVIGRSARLPATTWLNFKADSSGLDD
jgi:hypothetical protein